MTIRVRRPHPGARFIHPLDPEPRTAVLAAGFQETKLVRVFPQGWNEQAARFHPTCIAGPLEELRRAARAGVELEHAIVAFTYEGASGFRAAIANRFGMPSAFRCSSSTLAPTISCSPRSVTRIAGLHVVSGCDDLDLDHDPCPCGNPAPRLTRGARIEELAALLA